MVASYKVGDSVLVDGQIVDVFPGTGTYLVNVGIASCGGIGPDRLRPMNSARHVAPPEPVVLTDEECKAVSRAMHSACMLRWVNPRADTTAVLDALTELGFSLVRTKAEGGE